MANKLTKHRNNNYFCLLSTIIKCICHKTGFNKQHINDDDDY